MNNKPLVYFLCTGNSCRSQIADGFLKALGSDKYDKAERWHWGFDDPAKATGTEEEITATFAEVRDSIKARIEQFLKEGK